MIVQSCHFSSPQVPCRSLSFFLEHLVLLFRSGNFTVLLVSRSIAYSPRRFLDHGVRFMWSRLLPLLAKRVSLHERLPSGTCSRFRATLPVLFLPPDQENGIIPNQITTCTGHLKRSWFFSLSLFLAQSRRAEIFLTWQTGQARKCNPAEIVYCRSIYRRRVFWRSAIWNLYTRYVRKSEISRSEVNARLVWAWRCFCAIIAQI